MPKCNDSSLLNVFELYLLVAQAHYMFALHSSRLVSVLNEVALTYRIEPVVVNFRFGSSEFSATDEECLSPLLMLFT